jgi:hypothetical protein
MSGEQDMLGGPIGWPAITVVDADVPIRHGCSGASYPPTTRQVAETWAME